MENLCKYRKDYVTIERYVQAIFEELNSIEPLKRQLFEGYHESYLGTLQLKKVFPWIKSLSIKTLEFETNAGYDINKKIQNNAPTILKGFFINSEHNKFYADKNDSRINLEIKKFGILNAITTGEEGLSRFLELTDKSGLSTDYFSITERPFKQPIVLARLSKSYRNFF